MSDLRWNRVERLIGRQNLRTLSSKRVAVIGVGSGGGFAALSLAMSGVGNFVLIDDDRLEAANLARHVADARYIGLPKVEALHDLILQRNPAASVQAIFGRMEDHLDALEGIDLVVCGLDSEQGKYALNEACLERHLTALYGGVYERGEGGDVVVIHPYDGPCYACWAAELREGIAEKRDTGEALDYGMISADGTLEAEPGLWLHVTRVAASQADMTLNELLRESDIYRKMPGNTVILANTALEIIDGQITPPYSAVWVTISRNPDCLVCGDLARAHRSLSDAAADSTTGDSVSMDDLMASGIAGTTDEDM